MRSIFLSYAKEDKSRVDEIYILLKKAGLNPWMDDPPSPYASEGIPPGQDWDQFIRHKLRHAAVTPAFLSARSSAKQGYIQKEYRLALNTLMEKPPDKIYLIPVLLESITIPDIRVDTISLNQLQWYKLYERGIDDLIAHLTDLTRTDDPEQPKQPPSPEIIALKNQVRYLSWLRDDIVHINEQRIIKLEEELNRWKALYDEQISSDAIYDKFNRMDRF
jgi:hypothetical protein